jgi:hypothetical protein
MNMKKITNLLLAALMAVFFCSIGKAQSLIYSNAFNGPTVTVYQTAPTLANSLLGGSNNAVWICSYTNNTLPQAGTVNQDGTLGTNSGCALLPLTPQAGAIYFLSGSINIPASMADYVEIGFAQDYLASNNLSYSRFNDTPETGYGWMYNKVNLPDTLFGGPKATIATGNANLMPGAATYTWEVILNTLGAKWTVSSYINGTQLGTNIIYASNPPIGSCGVGQAQFATGAPIGIQWNYMTLSTALAPYVLTQPISASTSLGTAFTNFPVVVADTNGGAISYQWYTNNVPIANATNMALILNPVTAGDASTNYYLVATNIYGAITSSVVSLTVYSSPLLTSQLPVTYTNLFTLYSGANPSFSLSVNGSSPLSFRWFTNGVLDAVATTNILQITNVQIGTFSNYCIVTNSVGAVTSVVWAAQIIADPTNSTGGLSPYPQAVLALDPIGYWRMNDTNLDGPDDQNGDNGFICNDYVGGNSGIYTNVSLGNPGYNPTADPSDTSAQFGEVDENNDFGDSDANSIQGINFGSPANTSVAFTVEAWVSGYIQAYDAGIVALGYGNGGEQFDLDTGSDTAPTSHGFRFLIRDASGNTHSVSSTVVPSTVSGSLGPWYHLVGVVDEINNQNMTLYINGVNIGSASVASGSGLLAPTGQMSIGSRMGSQTSNFNNQFLGNINDVTVFNYALSPSQVAAEYQAGGGIISPAFLPPLPSTNTMLPATNTVLTIPATVFGEPPVGYYWTNVTAGGTVLGSGTTNQLVPLNATLTLSNITPSLLWSNVLELVVTNAIGSTNLFVYLSEPLQQPPSVTLSYTNPIIYSNSFVVGTQTIGGSSATAVNMLVGGTNTTWICTYTNGVGISNGTVYANGTLGTNAGNALLPFTPEPGYIYTMTASLTASSAMYNWVAMGFTQFAQQTNNPGYTRFTDTPNGYGWMYVENGSSVFFGGSRTSDEGGSLTGVPLPSATPITLQIILNTMTNNAWTVSAFVNNSQVGTNIVYSSNPPIGYAGIGQNQFLGSPPTGIQWNYWMLTQQGTNVPPYLLAPLPPTNVVLQPGATLTIPATVFGSAPLGYYWSNLNTATVLESGVTNTLAPIDATLTIPDVPASWGGNQLALTATNAYGTNITLITLSVVNPNPTNIVTTVTNNNLYLTWPTDHTGWQLQAQTNSPGVGISTNWANYNPSTGTNQVVLPINLTNGTVFFRLILQP